jgi:Bacterial PH domain
VLNVARGSATGRSAWEEFAVSFVQRHLISGEAVQYQTRLHWVVMIGHLVVALLLDVAAVALLFFYSRARENPNAHAEILLWVAVGAFVISAIVFAIGAIRRNATEMALTNKRVIVKTGLATRRTLELVLPRIESIVVEEPTLGRLLGYGTVIIRGTGGTPEVFEKIAHPLEFREQVQSELDVPPKQA